MRGIGPPDAAKLEPDVTEAGGGQKRPGIRIVPVITTDNDNSIIPEYRRIQYGKSGRSYHQAG